MSIGKLFSQIKSRPYMLKGLRNNGLKIVGNTGSYIPEELICASGAVPQRLCRGGDLDALEATLPYMIRFGSPFTRTQFGYYVSGIDPVYRLVDMLIAQCGDCHMANVADIFEWKAKMPIVKIGVPTDWDKPLAFQYYLSKIEMLRNKLEEFTGIKITDEKLREYINLYNEMRTLLKEINTLRKNPSPPLSGLDFIQLNHSSFYIDVTTMVTELKSLYNELKERKSIYSGDTPRILLLGRAVAVGDYAIPKSIEENGGLIVAEMLDEGIRHYGCNVNLNGDLMENLARRYYLDRLPSSWQQPSWGIRMAALEKIIDAFKIDGVIWYQLKFDEVYDLESFLVNEKLKAKVIPMLKLESSYEHVMAMGPIFTRIESFIESLKDRKGE